MLVTREKCNVCFYTTNHSLYKTTSNLVHKNKQNTPKINKQHLNSKYNNQQILTNNIYNVTSQHKIQHYTSCQSLMEVVYEVRYLQLTLLALQQACHHNHSG